MEPNVSKAEKSREAINRMWKLGLFDQIIEEFRLDGVIEYSEPSPLGGMLYWVSNEPEWESLVQEFEERYNALVYHVVHSYTEFGELLAFLFVSDYEEEWEYDNDDLEDGYVMSYVVNLDYPEFSEFGSIIVREASGGLIRIG